MFEPSDKPITEEQYLERLHKATDELFELLWLSNMAGTDRQPHLPHDWMEQLPYGNQGNHKGMYGIISDALKRLNPKAYESFCDSFEPNVRDNWLDPFSDDR